MTSGEIDRLPFFMDGFDDCVIGIVERFGLDPIICYDRNKVMDKLCGDMDSLEAVEHFDYNIIGAWVGPGTPCFLTPCDAKEAREWCEALEALDS